jgi:hypothetical protein
MMALAKGSFRLQQQLGRCQLSWLRVPSRLVYRQIDTRHYSSGQEHLPLAGVRVLDMTRVLAGVRYVQPHLTRFTSMLTGTASHTAPKFWAILGELWSQCKC